MHLGAGGRLSARRFIGQVFSSEWETLLIPPTLGSFIKMVIITELSVWQVRERNKKKSRRRNRWAVVWHKRRKNPWRAHHSRLSDPNTIRGDTSFRGKCLGNLSPQNRRKCRLFFNYKREKKFSIKSFLPLRWLLKGGMSFPHRKSQPETHTFPPVKLPQ